MLLQRVAEHHQRAVHFRPDAIQMRHLVEVLGSADAGHHVFALGVLQELAHHLLGAGRGVAGEQHAGAAVVAHIAEHHRLDVDGGAHLLVDLVELAVFDRPFVHPAVEHGPDGRLQLVVAVLREGDPGRFLERPFEDPAPASPAAPPRARGRGRCRLPSSPWRAGIRKRRGRSRRRSRPASGSACGSCRAPPSRRSAQPIRGAMHRSGRHSGSCPSCPASTPGLPSGPTPAGSSRTSRPAICRAPRPPASGWSGSSTASCRLQLGDLVADFRRDREAGRHRHPRLRHHDEAGALAAEDLLGLAWSFSVQSQASLENLKIRFVATVPSLVL